METFLAPASRRGFHWANEQPEMTRGRPFGHRSPPGYVSKQLTLIEAAKLHRGFFSTYPRLKEWQRTQSARVQRRSNWIAVTVLGRRAAALVKTKRARGSFTIHGASNRSHVATSSQ